MCLGDLLPADGILVQSSDLKIDESSLTGSFRKKIQILYARILHLLFFAVFRRN